jgi:4-hydroxy-L-threonine phosphate dehydrogenase PdxA
VQLRRILPAIRRKRPIAVLGLNPHAGENGLIGHFENRVLKSALLSAKRAGQSIVGPIPADTAFTRESLNRFSVVVSLYHDQGLIPFKMLHGQDSGFQVSLGLPFIRTSVDHGTAKDIFGQGTANSGSMVDAINGAIKLAHALRSNAKQSKE